MYLTTHSSAHLLATSPHFPNSTISHRLIESARNLTVRSRRAVEELVVAVFPRYIIYIPSSFPLSLSISHSRLRDYLSHRNHHIGISNYPRICAIMGSATVPSSAPPAPFVGVRRSPPLRRSVFFLSFDSNRPAKCLALVSPSEAVKEPQKSFTRAAKQPKRVKAVSVDAAPTAASSSSSPSSDSCDLNYNEVAAVLENIYKLSPTEISDSGDIGGGRRRRQTGRGRKRVEGEKEESRIGDVRNISVVRRRRRAKRLSLEKRVALRKKRKDEEGVAVVRRGERKELGEDVVERLVREHSVSADLASLDWKKMKIPLVLSSWEHTRLFKLMQPMKAILELKENLHRDLNREPTDGELAGALNTSVMQLRLQLEIGRAARNKLIKHNLRLVLFVINKYYSDIASGQKFQDLCQAGAKGLITAIDRFETKRGFRLSTYGLFWIRHSITRSMIISSFTRFPFGIESARQVIQKAKLELSFELGRPPSEEEIIDRVRISPERYFYVLKAGKPVLSLNTKHSVTQEEFINGITDVDGTGGDKCRQPALLRLALDDVLDSLKPKESVVIRQRYGLDGKGDRTLGEIAGNLNISREMVRKHELKALMKLKHPTRVDYLQRYF